MNVPTKLNGYQETATLLLDQTNPTTSSHYTLTDSIQNYRALLVLLANNSNAAEVKSFYIPSVLARSYTRYDCSWNATDSTSWYIVCTIQFNSDTGLIVSKLQRTGFTDSRLIIYGLK